MSDQEILVDDVETEMLRTRLALTRCVRAAAHITLKAISDRAEGAGTAQLADLAYAFACLEGARRGVLPGTPAVAEEDLAPHHRDGEQDRPHFADLESSTAMTTSSPDLSMPAGVPSGVPSGSWNVHSDDRDY